MRLLGLTTAVILGLGVALLTGCPTENPGTGDTGGPTDCTATGTCPDAESIPPDAAFIPPDAGDGGIPPDGGQDCTPGTSNDLPCGKGACIQKCQTSTHKYGACQQPAGPVDTDKDPSNCGMCGNICPTPVHASTDGGSGAMCVIGKCARGPCETGWFDFDRETTFGCEAYCDGTKCWPDGNPDGGSLITLTAPPLPERGLVFQAFASGSSLAGGLSVDGGYLPFPQTNLQYTNVGILGESTPLACGSDGGCSPTMSNATHKNIGGFMAIDHK